MIWIDKVYDTPCSLLSRKENKMKCKYKELLAKNAECDLTYPECREKVICYYEEKYHDLLMDAKCAEVDDYETD